MVVQFDDRADTGHLELDVVDVGTAGRVPTSDAFARFAWITSKTTVIISMSTLAPRSPRTASWYFPSRNSSWLQVPALSVWPLPKCVPEVTCSVVTYA